MSKNTINFKKILIWGAPTVAITAVMFILYRVLLNNFRFDAVLTAYMTVTTVMLLGYLIYNRGFSRRAVTESGATAHSTAKIRTPAASASRRASEW